MLLLNHALAMEIGFHHSKDIQLAYFHKHQAIYGDNHLNKPQMIPPMVEVFWRSLMVIQSLQVLSSDTLIPLLCLLTMTCNFFVRIL